MSPWMWPTTIAGQAGLALLAMAATWPLCAGVLYPLWLVLMRLTRALPPAPEPAEWPSVTVVVAARNAEAHIERKVTELLACDYPADKLQVVVVSDGSTDATAAVARSVDDPRLVVIELTENVGKTRAINGVVDQTSGDVLAFSDHSTRWRPDALRAMVRRAVGPGAGCACGRILYAKGDGSVAGGFSIYQRIEIRLRELAGSAGLLPSVSGAMHVVQRRHWRPMPPALTADLVLPQLVHLDGAGVVYAPEAIGEETPRESVAKELRARVRIAVRSVQSFAWAAPQLLQAGRLGPLFVLWSHKVLRWSLWVPAALALVGNVLLVREGWLWQVTLACQALVYVTGGVQISTGVRLLPGKLQSVTTYWTLAMIALSRGTLRGLFGEPMVSWKPED